MSVTIKTAAITTNTSTKIASSDQFLACEAGFMATVSIVQSGTGNWALNYSPDAGVTLIPVKDSSGVNVTGTATGGINVWLGKGSKGYPIDLYLVTTGVSGSITPYVHGA